MFVWKAPPGIPSSDLTWTPIELTLETIGFDNPVYVELMSGNVHELKDRQLYKSGPGTIFTKLPVRDSPILIAERLAIELTP